MVNKLVNGDYVVHGSGIVRLQGMQALLAQALFRLQCRRGSFPFLPELGSYLWKLGREKESDRTPLARQYAAQALRDLPLAVTDVVVDTVDDGLRVQVMLLAKYENWTVEVLI